MKREKVLIIEDDIDLVNLMDFNLTRKGYITQSSMDGIDAIRRLKEFKPQLIVLDLMLPKMDGWNICSYLKEQNIDCQILILTAKAMPEDRVRGFEIGADDYMTKPFDMKELFTRIDKLLAKRQEKVVFHDFVRIVGHDVANKMRAIAGLSEILQNKIDAIDGDMKKAFLKHINEAALGTTELISEIRTLIDIEAGEFVLHLVKVHILQLIADLVRMHQHAALQRGLIFDIAAEGAIPELELDIVAVKQVFANIIGNAVKYSRDGGGISIRIKKEGDSLVIKVKDNGCGIPRDDLPHIFEKGYRASNASNAASGTGMGLYIVKLLLNVMGATIEVKSEEGTGSEFIVTFDSPSVTKT
jgi:signal transduction histidine kinase